MKTRTVKIPDKFEKEFCDFVISFGGRIISTTIDETEHFLKEKPTKCAYWKL
jgi:hypothetical protein